MNNSIAEGKKPLFDQQLLAVIGLVMLLMAAAYSLVSHRQEAPADEPTSMTNVHAQLFSFFPPETL